MPFSWCLFFLSTLTNQRPNRPSQRLWGVNSSHFENLWTLWNEKKESPLYHILLSVKKKVRDRFVLWRISTYKKTRKWMQCEWFDQLFLSMVRFRQNNINKNILNPFAEYHKTLKAHVYRRRIDGLPRNFWLYSLLDLS